MANSRSNASAAVDDWVGQPTRVASIFSDVSASDCRVEPAVLVRADGIRSAVLSHQERFDGAGRLARTGQRDDRRVGVDQVRVVVGELQALHGFAWHAEHALQRLARGDHDGQRVAATDQHHASDAGGESIGDDVESCGVELQCCPYRRGLAEQFRSGRLDAEAEFRVQRVIARQGEDVGALGVGDPLDDGALTDVEGAGTRVEKRARGSTHRGWLRFRSSAMVSGSTGMETNGIPFVFRPYGVSWHSGYRTYRASEGRPDRVNCPQFTERVCSGDARGIARVAGRRHAVPSARH